MPAPVRAHDTAAAVHGGAEFSQFVPTRDSASCQSASSCSSEERPANDEERAAVREGCGAANAATEGRLPNRKTLPVPGMACASLQNAASAGGSSSLGSIEEHDNAPQPADGTFPFAKGARVRHVTRGLGTVLELMDAGSLEDLTKARRCNRYRRYSRYSRHSL